MKRNIQDKVASIFPLKLISGNVNVEDLESGFYVATNNGAQLNPRPENNFLPRGWILQKIRYALTQSTPDGEVYRNYNGGMIFDLSLDKIYMHALTSTEMTSEGWVEVAKAE